MCLPLVFRKSVQCRVNSLAAPLTSRLYKAFETGKLRTNILESLQQSGCDGF